jgi:transcriptional regulator GlxA family with amidase domain
MAHAAREINVERGPLTLAEIEIALFGEELTNLRRRLSYDTRTESVWNFVEAHFRESNLTNLMVARACGISPDNVGRLLRFYIRLTFRELLSRYRVHRAAMAFSLKADSVLNVAGFVGVSQATLERRCEEYLKMSPMQLRSQLRDSFRKVS